MSETMWIAATIAIGIAVLVGWVLFYVRHIEGDVYFNREYARPKAELSKGQREITKGEWGKLLDNAPEKYKRLFDKLAQRRKEEQGAQETEDEAELAAILALPPEERAAQAKAWIASKPDWWREAYEEANRGAGLNSPILRRSA